MAFGLAWTTDELSRAMVSAARAYADAVAAEDVLGAFDAAQRLGALADTAVAVIVIVTAGVVGGRADTKEGHP